MFENYEKYLNMIQGKLDSMFERQKPYIFCKKGCSLCCEKGEYPFSYLEFQYLLKGLSLLEPNLQEKIKLKAQKIKQEKSAYKGDGPFLHECPFLINGECTVYNYRGLVCRNFGLLVQREGKKPTVPFCSSLGLNYSNVYDIEKRCISPVMFQKSNIKIEPKIFNVSYSFLTEETWEKGYGFSFGDKKPLIDWF